MLQVPLEQSPEQHPAFVVHVLPDVVQPPPAPPSLAPPPMSAHFPPTQVSVQQSLPTAHAPPRETHCVVLHFPETQEPVQQSVFTAQVAAGALQLTAVATQTAPMQR